MALATGTWADTALSVSLSAHEPVRWVSSLLSIIRHRCLVVRTIKGIFGASGLTRTEVLSTPLVAYFGAKVDTHSYQAIPAQINLYATNPKSAKRTSFDLTESLRTGLTAISGR